MVCTMLLMEWILELTRNQRNGHWDANVEYYVNGIILESTITNMVLKYNTKMNWNGLPY